MDLVVSTYLPVFFLTTLRLIGTSAALPWSGRLAWAGFRWRLAACGLLGMALVPVCSSSAATTTGGAAEFLLLGLNELVVGAVFGFGIRVLFVGVRVAGQLIGQMSGWGLASVWGATAAGQGGPMAQLLDLVSMAVFLLVGGHRLVMEVVLATFSRDPGRSGRLQAGGTGSCGAAVDL